MTEKSRCGAHKVAICDRVRRYIETGLSVPAVLLVVINLATGTAEAAECKDSLAFNIGTNIRSAAFDYFCQSHLVGKGDFQGTT